MGVRPPPAAVDKRVHPLRREGWPPGSRSRHRCCRFCHNGGTEPVLPGSWQRNSPSDATTCGLACRRVLWSLRLPWGMGCSMVGIQHCGQSILVKCLVGQRGAKRRLVAQWRYSLAVVGLFRKQGEANEGAQPVHQCHHLCGQPTAGSANGLMLGRPPFCARSLLVNRDNGAVDEHHRRRIGMAAEDLESPRKHPPVYPSSEAGELVVPLAKARGQVPMANPFVHRP